MTYLTSEKYTLPKSEISYVKNELSLFLQLHEVYVKKKKKNVNQSCTTLSETDKKKMRVWEAFF
jgi:prenyltransferase beta subunit